MLDHAIKYATQFGWSVFPISPLSKIPLPGSRGFKDASNDPAIIKKLFENHPNANLGLATGEASGCWVLDIDCKNGKQGNESLRAMEEKFGKLPNTVTALTWSKGTHYFFKHRKDRPVPNVANVMKTSGFIDIDTRGNGGYVVISPSIYKAIDGEGKYDWEMSGIPCEVEIAEAPTWLYDLIEHGREEKKELLNEPILEQNRNETIFKHVCRLVSQGYPKDIIMHMALSTNQLRCKPPLSEKEVNYIVASAYERYSGGVQPIDIKRYDLKLNESLYSVVKTSCAIMSESCNYYRSPTGQVVRIDRNGLQRVNRHMMASELTKHIRYIKMQKKEWVECRPDRDLADQVLVSQDLEIRNIVSVTTVPRFTADGVVSHQQGYRSDDKSFYIKKYDIAKIGFQEGIDLINEFLCDFAWADSGLGKDKTNAMALLFCPPLMGIIGNFPLHAVSSIQERTGKSLLVECITSIYGHFGALCWNHNNDELSKKITSVLISAPMFICFDNIKNKIEHPSLEACLTTGIYMDRILGCTEMARIQAKTLWTATGNHLSFGSEMIKRSVISELNAHVSNPEHRSGFRHPNLKVWVDENRSRLLGAIYAIIEEWFRLGAKRSEVRMGGFEAYSSIVGGILEMIGQNGFLDSPVESAQDIETELACNILALWYENINKPIQGRESEILGATAYSKDLLNIAESCGYQFREWTRDESARSNSLGKYLKKISGRYYGEFKCKNLGRHHGRVLFKIEAKTETDYDKKSIF